jgi:hypothetical protein
MSTPTPPREPATIAKQAFEMFGRHFVSLAILFKMKTGSNAGTEFCRNYSGFILTIQGAWNLVTAGHGLKQLRSDLQSGDVEITRSYLIDSYGAGRVTDLPNWFDFESAPKTYVYEEEEGLDYGLILLRPYYQSLLQANKIQPFSELDWVKQPREFEAYFMVGLPFHLNPKELQDDGVLINFAMIQVEKLDGPPAGVEPTAYPRFWGKLKTTGKVEKLEGMSGGPIFGFAKDKDANDRYWPVAIQSGWYESWGIVAGTPVPLMGQIMDYMLTQPQEEECPVHSSPKSAPPAL